MTKKEKQYLDNLEECFDKLQYDYECSQNTVKELETEIAALKNLCRENHIKIPQLDKPF